MIQKLKEMDKVCLLIPEFCDYDGISQLIKRYVHACIITGIKKPFILCTKWNGYIPKGWTLGKVTQDGMYEIEVVSIEEDELYCWDNKETAIQLLEGLRFDNSRFKKGSNL